MSKHPHLDYGYALTSHSSQGQTADRVLIHVDTEQGPQLVNARMAYVAISRGRYDGQIYTNSRADLADHLTRDHSHSTAITSSQHNQQGYASLESNAGHEQAGTAQSQGHAQGTAQGGGIGV